MKKLLLLLSAAFISSSSFAEVGKDPVEWGKFSKEELEMKSYSLDSSASAVILTKYGSVSFDVLGSTLYSVYELFVRIKILDESGFKYGDIKIPYREGKNIDRFVDLKAHTINVGSDGKIIDTKVNKDLIIDEDVNGFYHQKKFAFPDLHKGSIIEYYYRIKSDDISILKEWNFQDEIPIAWCEYRTLIPSFFNYSKMTRGIDRIDKVNEDKTFISFGGGVNGMHHEDVYITAYIIKNVKAIQEEPFSIHPISYCSFQLQLNSITIPGEVSTGFLRDWKEFSDYIDRADWLGDQYRSQSFVKDLSNEIANAGKNQKDKITMLYDYVRENIVWNGDYDLHIDDLKTSFKNKTGNGTEVNAILLCMLRAVGINADPVLVCTRDHGIIEKNKTFLTQFNHLVVKAISENEEFILDGTDHYRPMSLQNANVLGISGYIPKEDGYSWIQIKNATPSKEFYSYLLTLGKDDKIKGKVNYSCNSYSGLSGRKKIKKYGLEDYLKDLLNTDALNITTDSINVQNLDSINGNLIIKSNISGTASSSDKFIYLTPYLNPDLHVNPFKAELRQNPVEFYYPGSETSTMILQVPDGYKIDEIPKSAKVTLPDSAASFTFISSNTNNQIQLKSILTINKIFYPVEEYKEVRDFFSNISTKYSEQIVISKE